MSEVKVNFEYFLRHIFQNSDRSFAACMDRAGNTLYLKLKNKMLFWKCSCRKERQAKILENDKWLNGLVTDWLTDWLTDRLTDWLTDWLTDRLTDWQTDWLQSQTITSSQRYGQESTWSAQGTFLQLIHFKSFFKNLKELSIFWHLCSVGQIQYYLAPFPFSYFLNKLSKDYDFILNI